MTSPEWAAAARGRKARRAPPEVLRPQAEHIALYSYALSPYAAKVHCFLAHKRLRFETVYVNPLRLAEELPLGRQIPVLEIDDELRGDSTPIGLWLEERHPERPALLPRDPEPRRRVLAIDAWVSDALIPVVFRTMLAAGEPLPVRIRNRRRGARVLHATVPAGIPWPLRLAYPFVVTRPAFIRRLLAATDASRSNHELRARVCTELVQQLDGGPFLGAQPEPSLADLSAYAQLALPYLAGYDGADHFVASDTILAWLRRVASGLAGAPPLLPEPLAERSLAWLVDSGAA